MKEKYLQQIIDTYVKKDIRDLADIKDIDKFNKLIETLRLAERAAAQYCGTLRHN